MEKNKKIDKDRCVQIVMNEKLQKINYECSLIFGIGMRKEQALSKSKHALMHVNDNLVIFDCSANFEF